MSDPMAVPRPTAIGQVVPTTYTVNLDEPMHEWITVVLTCRAGGGPHKPTYDTWAIRKSGLCLDRGNEWVWEPIPSSRDDNFLEQCRWPLEEALRAAVMIAEREALWRRDAR